MNPLTRPGLDDVNEKENEGRNDHAAINEKPAGRPRLVPMTRQSSFEASSDKAAASLVRKVLLSHQFNNNNAPSPDQQPSTKDAASLDGTLPPLTSSNDIDLQLYALIAILLKDCVYSWYSRFTTDHTLVDDVIQMIAHCTRALEGRLRSADLESLFLDEVPALVEAHVQTVRQCRTLAASHNSLSDTGKFYTMFRPHPALLPLPDPWDHVTLVSQSNNDAAYRQMLAEGIVLLLLPTEDLQNHCLRSIVTEVISDMILGGIVSNKLCDGIFLYETITKVCGATSRQRKPWALDTTVEQKQSDRLARYGLMDGSKQTSKAHFDLAAVYNVLISYLLLAFNFLCVCIDTGTWIAKLPRRPLMFQDPHAHNDASVTTHEARRIRSSSTATVDTRLPMVSLRLWTTISTIINIPSRMPWGSGTISLLQHLMLFGPGRLGRADAYMDRLMAHYILTPIFPLSKQLPNILSGLRTTLFPNNSLPSSGTAVPAGADPRAQKRQARRAAAFAILNAVPASVAKTYYAPSVEFAASAGEQEAQQIEQMVTAIEDDILAPFGEDDYVMRHLMYAIVDRVMVEVFPELGRQSVSELLVEKGIKSGLV